MSQSTSDKLFSARLKIKRAKEHIVELDVAIRAFFDTKPYKVGTKRDPNTRRLIYNVACVEDVPMCIPVIAGEAIQCLRSALDHLAYQLVLAGSGGPNASASRVYFPIYEDAAKYQAGKMGRIQGMRQNAINAIDAIQPYKGGKGEQLWVLNKLNNTDKHRLLVTVSSAFRSIDLGAHTSRHLQQIVQQAQQTIPDYPVHTPPTMHVFFRTDPMVCPLKTGDELFTDSPDAEVNEEMQFKFDIALNEPEIVQGKSLLETLHQLADLVDGIVTQLAFLL